MRFENVFNHKPQVKESANARVNLIGEHTDYTCLLYTSDAADD